MALKVVPLTLKQANDLVTKWHRHHKPSRGHRFSIGVEENGELVGAAICGRPVARAVDQYNVLEVSRLVTNGGKNACSKLYSAAARAAREMGFRKIQTYILSEEHGTSLTASGWEKVAETAGGDWTSSSKPNRRQDQPQGPKSRWEKELNDN
jgi:hypothetical protein